MAKTLKYRSKKNRFYNIDSRIVVPLDVDGTFIGTGSTDDHIGVYIDGTLKKTIGIQPDKVILTSGDGLRAGSLHSVKFAIMTGSNDEGRTALTNSGATTEKIFFKINPITVDPSGKGRVTSISDAVDLIKTLANPEAGHQILLSSGTYSISSPIDLKGCDNIKIYGRPRDASKVVLSGSNPAPSSIFKTSHSASYAFLTMKNTTSTAIDCIRDDKERTVYVEGVIIEQTSNPIKGFSPRSRVRRSVIRKCNHGLKSSGSLKCAYVVFNNINTTDAPLNGGWGGSYAVSASSGSVVQNCTIYNVTGACGIQVKGGTIRNCIISTSKFSNYAMKADYYKRNLTHKLTT